MCLFRGAHLIAREAREAPHTVGVGYVPVRAVADHLRKIHFGVLRFRDQGLGFRVTCAESMTGFGDAGFRIDDLGFRVQDLGLGFKI